MVVRITVEPRLMMIEDGNGNKLGIQFNPDDTFSIGGWNEDGEWVDLEPRAECEVPTCKDSGHTRPFPLNQYKSNQQDDSQPAQSE